MRALWAGDGASFSGEFVKFDKVNCNPKPVAKSVPIVVGGHSEAAAHRAGRLGDGFFPSIGAQVDTVPLLDVVRRSAEQAGRDPGDGGIDPRLSRCAAQFRLRPRVRRSKSASRGAWAALRCQ